MNGAHQLYLKTYGIVDTADGQIKKCDIGYRSWKYWIAAKNHALALGVVTVYSIYQEIMKEGYVH